MGNKVEIPEHELRELYLEKQLSIAELSRKYNTSNVTLKKRMSEFGIERRKQKIDLTSQNAELIALHHDQKMTIKDIAKLKGVSHSKMHSHFVGEDITVIDFARTPPPPQKELESLYEEDCPTFVELGKHYSVSNVTVRNWFDHYGIPMRDRSDIQKMKSHSMPSEEYIKQCHIIHDNKYNYDNMNYDRAGGDEKIVITCPEHGDFRQRPMHHLGLRNGCPKCGNLMSLAEDEIISFLNKYDITTQQSYRQGLSGQLEIDVFLPDHNIGIEYDGLYWHSDKFKHKNYHREKTKIGKQNGIDIIHIFENEWIQKKEIWQSILLSKLGKIQNRIFARKCRVDIVDTKMERVFLDTNHLQGYTPSKICYGLYFEDVLVAVMSFSQPRFNKKYEWEIVRFAGNRYCTVVGGASKLFKRFLKDYSPKTILSYADNRFSSGGLYETLGFTKTHDTTPNYFYFKGKDLTLRSRHRFQKHRLSKILPDFDEKMSEYENLTNHGYNRIWDCGNSVWVWIP